jgi:hypothetical protein
VSGIRRWTLTTVSLWSIHTQTCTFQGWTYGFGLFFPQQRVCPHVATQGRPLPLPDDLDTPRPWATLGGSINILQQSNAEAQTRANLSIDIRT